MPKPSPEMSLGELNSIIEIAKNAAANGGYNVSYDSNNKTLVTEFSNGQKVYSDINSDEAAALAANSNQAKP